jgi:hypothetical protein
LSNDLTFCRENFSACCIDATSSLAYGSNSRGYALRALTRELKENDMNWLVRNLAAHGVGGSVSVPNRRQHSQIHLFKPKHRKSGKGRHCLQQSSVGSRAEGKSFKFSIS